MSSRRVVIYMPEALAEALNRATADSPQSRSEIICEALERYLTGDQVGAPLPEDRQAFYARVTEMIENGLLRPGDFHSQNPEQNPKSKLWIN
jgi:metal-responsive CopG/Arc/MetJ family transcriptional regulator